MSQTETEEPETSWRDPDIETLRLSKKITSRLRAAKIEHVGALVDALDNGETWNLDAREITTIWHLVKQNSACPRGLVDGEPLPPNRATQTVDSKVEPTASKTEATDPPANFLDNWPAAPLAAVYNPAVPLDKIAPSPTNPRKTFDPVKLGELAKSIAEKGVLEPILLRPRSRFTIQRMVDPVDDRDAETPSTEPGWYVVDKIQKEPHKRYCDEYHTEGEARTAAAKLDEKHASAGFEIVAGERRYRATKLAGLTTIPATIRDYSDRDVVEIQIIENDQREDVHELEQAEGYATLIRLGIADAETLAIKIGRTPKYVYARLALNGLIDEWKADFAAGKITFAVATLLARLPESRQRQVLPTKDLWGNHQSPVFNYQMQCQPLVAVKRQLQHALIDLSSARWKLDDAELLPSAGSCKACPKRTGSKPDLFAELVDGADPDSRHDDYDDDEEYDDDGEPIKRKAKSKKPAHVPDFCTDSVCFSAKGAALVQLTVRKVAEKAKVEPEKIPVISERYTTPDGSGMLGASAYTEITPKEVKAFGKSIPADVVQAVIGDGDEAGKTVHIRLRKEATAARGSLAGGDSNDAFAKQQREQREKNELDKAMQKQVVANVIEKFETGGQKTLEKCWDKLASLFAREMGGDARYRLGGAFDVGKDDLANTIRDRGDTKPYSVLGMFVAATVASMPPRADYVSPDTKAFLAALGIDYTAILKSIAAERKAAKASKQKPAAKKKPAKSAGK